MNSIEYAASKITGYDFPYDFSVCTLVTRMDQYQLMLQSFIDAGFSKDKCEYLYIDNSKENQFDAYSAMNIFLQKAQGKYIIICHQDIELRYDRIDVLKKRILELDSIDPKWALIGNAGVINLKFASARITHGDPPAYRESGRTFPQKVITLDENFILIKKKANLAVSSDLKGFHFYGADICLIASILGYNAYVIDFHLYHKSTGNYDEEFYSLKKAFQKKYNRAFKGRYLKTITRQKFYISGSKLQRVIFNNAFARNIGRNYLRFRWLLKGNY